ncbi:MAG: chorismate-binding protein [Betaproteobacteria bacterium]
MIGVRSKETLLDAAAADAAPGSLESDLGVWMGCDVVAEGLYRRESIACTRAALRLCLDGRRLAVTPLTDTGAALLKALGRFPEKVDSGTEVARILKRVLAAFASPSRELALFGAYSFDYYRLGEDAPLPDDGRRRMVLYFPEQVVVTSATGARRIDFAFDVAPARLDPGADRIDPVRIAGDADELAPGGHAARVARGIERLRRGELYSLVLSQTFRRRGAIAPARAFAALRRRNPYPAMFFCNLGGGEVLFGASPDLQFRADASWVESAPVCGTLRRGAEALEDADQAFALLSSDKEGAAIALCADAAASEHASVCDPGSVEVLSHRRAHFFSTIVHAIDHLRGRRRAGLDAVDLLLAHATPATVTGLPKAAAVRVIGELEADWRGWYAGAVARLGTDGSAEAYTILRAARVADGVAEIRTGGNILVDSNPDSEEEESRLKALTLFRVLEDVAPVAAPVESAGTAVRRRVRGPLGADPFARGLVNALAKAGVHAGVADAGIAVLSGIPADGRAPAAPLLAVGEGALWLLEQASSRSEPLPRPEFARRIAGMAAADRFLAELGGFEAGWYASRAIRADGLPPQWIASALSTEGWVLAAEQLGGSACALLFRPDSVLSQRGAAGTRALGAAMTWLERGMFPGTPQGGHS